MPDLAKNLNFKLMTLSFNVRDRFWPPLPKLVEAGIQPGQTVLDFGCGPGAFALAAARAVGKNGKVHALDILPAATEHAKKEAAAKGIGNIDFIVSGLETGLEDESVDLALLYDILHHLKNRHDIVAEIHRVLKPDGILSVSDHHMRQQDILDAIAGGQGFDLADIGKQTINFVKAG